MQTATDTANAELLSKFSDAFNSHNVGALMACMTEDCVFDAVGGSEVHGVRFEGQAAVAKAFEQVWINMPDAQWLDGNHWVTGERGVSEWTFRVPMPKVPAWKRKVVTCSRSVTAKSP